MIVINLVLFIGLLLLARDLQSLAGNGFSYFCVHGSLVKGEGKEANNYVKLLIEIKQRICTAQYEAFKSS